MQELKVVQRIGRRRRAFSPAVAFPAPIPAWRNTVRAPHTAPHFAPHRSRPRLVSANAFSVRAAQGLVGLPSRRFLPLALAAAVVCAFGAVALALALSGGLGRLSLPSPPQNDPLHLRAMQTYAGYTRAATGSTSLEAGDGALLNTVETFSWETYVVKNGDSVSSLAQSRSLSIDSIIALNGVTNVKRLRAGSTIRIPNMDGVPYTVRPGDSLGRIAASWGIPMTAILDANDLSSETIAGGRTLFLPGARMRKEELKKALGELFIYPIRGRLTSGFGWRNDPFTGARRFHAAIDLAGNTGAPVKAAMEGRVSAIGVNAVYGKYVIVAHDGGYQTMYAHLNAIRTSKGTRVDQGERIGDVGTTGYSTGPHLHFAIYRNGRALNPLQFLGR